jgi:hypothetical protein
MMDRCLSEGSAAGEITKPSWLVSRARQPRRVKDSSTGRNTTEGVGEEQGKEAAARGWKKNERSVIVSLLSVSFRNDNRGSRS